MVDTPFVDENFQRAYRNTFKGQVSSGRDLHVSDVVIPVVDFSPTTAGTSLALNLRQARNIDGTNITLDQGDASTTFQDLTGAGTTDNTVKATSAAIFAFSRSLVLKFLKEITKTEKKMVFRNTSMRMVS